MGSMMYGGIAGMGVFLLWVASTTPRIVEHLVPVFHAEPIPIGGSSKQAFAEILGEPTVPKDWGGERSDLFSDWVVLDGIRTPTAFLFKGPSKFQPMTAADLGKNGDQIDRLFTEPAELLVLQHCHEVTLPVRGMMRAYSNQIGNPRLFCIINGYDTIQMLRAYSKCGLSSTASESK